MNAPNPILKQLTEEQVRLFNDDDATPEQKLEIFRKIQARQKELGTNNKL